MWVTKLVTKLTILEITIVHFLFKINNVKECFKCGLRKPLTEFYKHAQMGDGHLNKCKGCTRVDVKRDYEKNIVDPIWKEREQKRGRDKYHRLYVGTARAKPEGVRRWAEKFPEKNKAKNYAQHLIPPFAQAQRHHWSYNEEHYKDVIWLTRREHGKAHRFLTYAQEHRMYRMKHTGELLDTKEKHEFYIRYCIKFYED